MITFTIPGLPPSVNHYLGHRQAKGRVFKYLTEAGRTYKRKVIDAAIAKKLTPHAENVSVHIHLHFPDNRRRDIDNYSKVLLDSLNQIAWIDDSQVTRLFVSKNVDVDNPRVEIVIMNADEL